MSWWKLLSVTWMGLILMSGCKKPAGSELAHDFGRLKPMQPQSYYWTDIPRTEMIAWFNWTGMYHEFRPANHALNCGLISGRVPFMLLSWLNQRP